VEVLCARIALLACAVAVIVSLLLLPLWRQLPSPLSPFCYC
jgi:hypothetical protein